LGALLKQLKRFHDLPLIETLVASFRTVLRLLAQDAATVWFFSLVLGLVKGRVGAHKQGIRIFAGSHL
jgi:hypothetical protein